MSISNTTENAILNLIFNATAWANYADNAASSPQTNIGVSLHTADPGDAGDATTSGGSLYLIYSCECGEDYWRFPVCIWRVCVACCEYRLPGRYRRQWYGYALRIRKVERYTSYGCSGHPILGNGYAQYCDGQRRDSETHDGYRDNFGLIFQSVS
jgi:hypothetical protein